jgi:hypothetical protein
VFAHEADEMAKGEAGGWKRQRLVIPAASRLMVKTLDTLDAFFQIFPH